MARRKPESSSPYYKPSINKIIFYKLKKWADAQTAQGLPGYSAPEVINLLMIALLMEVSKDPELQKYEHDMTDFRSAVSRAIANITGQEKHNT